MQLSVYHNMLIIGSNSSSSIYLWNYEYGKLIGEIRLNDEIPISISIINGFALIIVTTSLHRVYLFKFHLYQIELEI